MSEPFKLTPSKSTKTSYYLIIQEQGFYFLYFLSSNSPAALFSKIRTVDYYGHHEGVDFDIVPTEILEMAWEVYETQSQERYDLAQEWFEKVG